MLETVVSERERAQQTYEDKVGSGETAVIGGFTKSQKDMFRITIGNFPPLSSAELKVFYFQQLEIEDLSLCLKVPMSYIPRYMGDIAKYITTGV